MESDPADQPAPAGASVRQVVERSTRLAVGLLGGVADAAARALEPGDATSAPSAPGEPSGAGDVVVGIVLTTQDRVLDATERAAGLLGLVLPVSRRIGELPGVRSVTDAVGRQAQTLAERGAAERAQAEHEVGETVDAVVGQVTASQLLGQTIEEVVAEVLPGVLDAALPQVFERLGDDPSQLTGLIDKLLDPILEEALPLVMDRLNEDPEVVRQLVMGQSTSIAGDLAGVVRSRTVLGDDLVERIARRVTFRRPRAELGPASSPPELPAGGTS